MTDSTESKELAETVTRANREYHNSLDPEDYHENPSIFGAERQREIRGTLEEISSSGGRLLDVGCGTGNILDWAKDGFHSVYGVDISENMLKMARQQVEEASFGLADATRLPFSDRTFQAVTFYAALHHFPNPDRFLTEALRVLKPGGYIYTDHDPNYYLVRFYYPFFRLMYAGSRAFGSEQADLAEYFHTQEPGIDPEQLAASLRGAGASEVSVQYRNTTNKNLSPGKSAMLSVIKPLASVLDWPSFYTHFSIIARK